MGFDTLSALFGLTTLTLGLSVGILLVLTRFWVTSKPSDILIDPTQRDGIVFLFDDEELVDATEAARQLINNGMGTDWGRLKNILARRFPTLTEEMSSLAERGTVLLTSESDDSVLKCAWRNGLARVQLLDANQGSAEEIYDRTSFEATQAEVDTLRAATNNLPFLLWRCGPDGKIDWANSAYLDYDSETRDRQPTWPPNHIFDQGDANEIPKGSSRRLPLTAGSEETTWFDVHHIEHGGDTFFAATSAGAAVDAENALKEFTQTLTKTFAHLTIGLAVFDKDRNLSLFNPALTDLTELPFEFLARRPSLVAFLDLLRDRNMVPEPKDYKSWRGQISALEDAAEGGTYEELWSLPGGATYRVTGRPHPNHAIAFVFENITAEMSLTRRYRADIETSQNALNALHDAIAVFSRTGDLILTNEMYSSIWGESPLAGLGESKVETAIAAWHAKCAPTQLWNEARAFIYDTGAREEITGSTRLWDGRKLMCRFSPLPNGQTLAAFRPEQNPRSTTPLKVQPRKKAVAEF